VQTVDFARIPPWERMRSLVASQLAADPVVRDVSHAVEASRFGVRMRWGSDAVSVSRFQWYLPLTEERARRLAADLALQARDTRSEAA
jgi:hypothetical protein